jgi:DNA repair exonuclease SbcCD nuclease subunit
LTSYPVKENDLSVMNQFSFIHAADLHLGSPFKGLRSIEPGIGDFLVESTFSAFDNIINECITRRVDFLLIAGDIFDSRDRGLGAQLRFRDALTKLSNEGIASFIVHGNHDPLSGWAATLDWPDSVKIFGSNIETVPFVREEKILAHIQGISYPRSDIRENLSKRFERPQNSPFSIGLLHANVGTDTGHEAYSPCVPEDLIGSGFDYWALGHVHSKKILFEKYPAVVYPGNTQGLHINESGEHGVYQVTVSPDGTPDIEFIATDVVRWKNCTGDESFDISGVESEGELLDILYKKCCRLMEDSDTRNVIARIEITGRTSLHRSLLRNNFIFDLESRLRENFSQREPFLWIERLVNSTRLPLNIEERREAGDFVAGLLNLIEQHRSDNEKFANLAEESLSDLYIHEKNWPMELCPPGMSELESMLDEVEIILLDSLLPEDVK